MEFRLEDLSYKIVQRIKLVFQMKKDIFLMIQFSLCQVRAILNYSMFLDHKNIQIFLSEEFNKSMLKDFVFCFNSMPIDEYFKFEYGALPYRSIKFNHIILKADNSRSCNNNYSDSSKFTRETCGTTSPIITKWIEDYLLKPLKNLHYQDNNFERYYPVKTSDDKYGEIYKKRK